MNKINLMEVCGTHTHAIAKSGIKSILSKNINLISGPGCPVCVTSQKDIDKAIWLASNEDVIFCTFGDMLKVPGSFTSLEKLNAEGKDIRVILSAGDCIDIALKHSEKIIIFMAVGFETTSPTVAITILKAKELKIKNLKIFTSHKLIIPAIAKLLQDKDLKIDGFILPGHVSTIIGKKPYDFIAEKYKKAGVITGFSSEDILNGIKMLISQIENNNFKIEIQYKRAVKEEGNPRAIEILYKVFEKCDCEWRGLGIIKNSGLKLKKNFKEFDAEIYFNIPELKVKEQSGCICGDILKGIKKPFECELFGTACTPLKPVGPCMVSSEGTCSAYYRFS